MVTPRRPLRSRALVAGILSSVLFAALVAAVSAPPGSPTPRPVLTVTPSVVAQWGSWGSGPGQFLRPWGIETCFVDGADRILVADYGSHRVQAFDAGGHLLFEWGTAELGKPSRLAVGPGPEIFVLDRATDSVRVFSPQGSLLRSWGSRGSGEGQFDTPCGIAVDAEGRVYVADGGLNEVLVFDARGRLITRWGGQGAGRSQFQLLGDVAVASSGGATRVFTLDGPPNNRVTAFSGSGDVLDQWGRSGSGSAQFDWPTAIATDRRGLVYVSDDGNARIQVFKADGSPVAEWSVADLGTVCDLAVDSTGRVYVIDEGALQIRGYAALPDLTPPTTTVTGVDDKWHNKTVTLTFAAKDGDGGSGVDRTESRTWGYRNLSEKYEDTWGPVSTGSTTKVTADPNEPGWDGRRRVEFRSVDRAGNSETTQTVTVLIDATAPVARVLSVKASTVEGRDKVVVRIWVSEELSEKVRFDLALYSGKKDELVLSKKTGWVKRKRELPYTWSFSSALEPGRYTVIAAATDLAGNGGDPASAQFLVK